MDENNPVVKLCAEGMRAEGEGRPEAARELYQRAWSESRDDFEACVAAHYLARQQPSAGETFRWNREALECADAAADERVRGFYPSLYLNMGKSHEELGDLGAARRCYQTAAKKAEDLPDDSYGTLVRHRRRSRSNRPQGRAGIAVTAIKITHACNGGRGQVCRARPIDQGLPASRVREKRGPRRPPASACL